MTRISLLPIFLLILAVSGGHSALAKDSFFTKWFGPAKTGKEPEVTLQAPFPTGKGKAGASGSALMNMYDDGSGGSSTAFDVPHRNPEQIEAWVAGAVTAALSIDPTRWRKDSQTVAATFFPYGLQEYQTFLANSNMLGNLDSGNLRLEAIVDGRPSVMREGAIDGTYHWLLKVPLMLTYYDLSTKKIEKGVKLNAQSQKVIVQVQVGRQIGARPEEMGIAIERWSVQPGS